MARTQTRAPARRVRKVIQPVRLQDGRSLESKIEAGTSTVITPIEERVTTIETTLEALVAGVTLNVADVDLVAGAQGGQFSLQILVDESLVGAPVLITQQVAEGDALDEMEFGIVLFVGRIVDPDRMDVAWFSPMPAPARARIAYLIGAVTEEV